MARRAKFKIEDYTKIEKKYGSSAKKQSVVQKTATPNPVVSSRKSFFKSRFFTGLLVFCFVVLTCAFIFTYLEDTQNSSEQTKLPPAAKLNTLKTSPSKSIIRTVKAATPSATVKPQTTATESATLPEESGRSIGVPILYYHYIGLNPNPADTLRDQLSVHPDVFEEQMAYIAKNGYSTISLDTMYAALMGKIPLPPKPVILTFDDGYIDFYINAFPVLRKYNLHATAFIPTGLMDQGYYLHWNQIKEMDATGLISFQAHSVTHASLPSLSNEAALKQMIESKKVLEQQLGKPVNFMAYPYGTNTPEIDALAKQAGYLGAAGTWFGKTQSEGTLYDMPREKVGGNFTIEEFATRL